MDWLDIGAGFDWISPAVKSLRGFNQCVATGGDAERGHDILKAAKIPCAFDSSPYMSDCYLSVRAEDVDRANKALSGK